MDTYNITEVKTVLSYILQANITTEGWIWFNAQSDADNTPAFSKAFVMMPRKTGKAVLEVGETQQQALANLRPGFTLNNWTADKLARVVLLIQHSKIEKDTYFKDIENLFSAAEMNEQDALYAALPLLPYPSLWIKRCAEGIRSNIGIVLEAIMYHNPYPAENLDEPAWNQMILKAFFTEKQMDKIYGLDHRANGELARILIDYAKERHAADRGVDPMLWHLVGKFIDNQALHDMKQGRF